MLSNKHSVINFGPQHPAAHGVLRLIVELDGEVVVNTDPHIGFLHRGTEKLIETKTYKQAIPYFDRLDYVSMMAQEHGYVLAVEYLLNIKPTKKQMYVRILFDEFTRLLNHIMCITTHALDVGALTPFLWGFEEREKILSFYEKVSGARMHAAFYTFGGVHLDIPDLLLEQMYDFVWEYNHYINILDDLLSNNIIWLSRLEDVGVINKNKALDFSFSGPVIRGSGIPWDLRKTQPYSCYSDIQFNIPVSYKGDCYSRYYVRLLEMKESLKIISNVVEILTNSKQYSKINFNKFQKISNSRNNFKTTMEDLIFSFYNNSVGNSIKSGGVSCYIEAPKGETGVYLLSDGSNHPYRCKIKSPGFFHLQGLGLISKNALIADIVTNIGSLDIVFGEIDR